MTEENQNQTPEDMPEGMPSMEEIITMIFAGMDTKQVLGLMFGVLAEKAWENMGLKIPHGQKEEVVDLESAQIAIDTIIFINDKLKDTVSEEETKFAKNLISNLQINFVNKQNTEKK